MILLLWCLCFFLDIRAEEVAETLYRVKDQTVCLNPGGPPPYNSTKWNYGDKIITSNNNPINPDFKKKMQYHKSNATLCIKNLSEKDNGIYTISYEQSYTEKKKKYSLIVKDAVPKPSLTVEQRNVSVDVCIFTVNCSVQHHWLWSECDKHGCLPAHEAFPELNITVSTDDRNLTCTGYNHVSSKAASQQIEELCFTSGHQKSPDIFIYLVWILPATVLAPVVFVLFCLGVKLILRTRRIKQPQVIQSQPFEQHSQPRISTSSTQAEVTYENVDPENANDNSDQEVQNGNVHTIYCVLEPLPASAAKNCEERTSETSEEQRQTDQSDQVHTVYSVIQKPKV